MSYHYEGNGSFSTDEQRKQNKTQNTGGQKPQPPNSGSDVGSWVLIGIMFMVAWPIGLFLLIKKLSQDGKKRPQTASAAKKNTAKTAKSKAASVTRTPNDTSKGARILNIVGTVLAVAGGIVGLSVLADLSFYFGEYGSILWLLEELFVALGLMSGGISLLLFGRGMKRRMRRFSKYLAVAGNRQSVSVARLASAAEVSERRVEKDLDIMIERGMWGREAWLDLGAGKLFRSAEAEEEKERPMVPVQTEEGYSGMLRKIRRANDRIADETLSRQIDRLEAIAGRIFRLIEEEPAKKAKASTFLNYYLPTTQKLLDSYAEFEEAGVSGSNLSQAKRKIEQTMDNIVSGFERQLDELYRTDAMDIDSDIRVMETMLRRDSASVEDDFGLGGAAVQMQEE